MDNSPQAPQWESNRQSQRREPRENAVRDDVSQDALIGLGKSSIRKNYYADLQRSLTELQRFRDLLDRSNDGILLISFPELEILDCNQAAAYLLEKEDGCAGGCIVLTDVLEPHDIEGLEEFCIRSKDDDSYTWMVRFRRDTDSPVSAEITLRRVQYGDREFLVGTAHDITDRELLTQRLRNSLREKEVMLREIHHRVGNNYQLINSLLALELGFSSSGNVTGSDTGTADDSEATSASFGHRLVRNTIDRVQSMAAIHADLYRAENFDRIAMLPLTQALLHRVIAARVKSTKDIEVSVTGSPIELDMGRAVPVSLMLNELTTNSIEHVYRKQQRMTLNVRWETHEGNVQLKYSDDGPGLPPNLDIRNPGTLGLTLITNLAQQAHANLLYSSQQGAQFILTFSQRP